MEYVMASYEIYIPEDVPLSEYGTSAPPYLYFSLYGTDGGSIEANGYVYIGLIGEDITVEAPDSLFPGDSMTGVFLFARPRTYPSSLSKGTTTTWRRTRPSRRTRSSSANGRLTEATARGFPAPSPGVCPSNEGRRLQPPLILASRISR